MLPNAGVAVAAPNAGCAAGCCPKGLGAAPNAGAAAPNAGWLAGAPKADGAAVAPKPVLKPPAGCAPKPVGVVAAAPKAGVLVAPKKLDCCAPKAGAEAVAPNPKVGELAAPKPVPVAPNGAGCCEVNSKVGGLAGGRRKMVGGRYKPNRD